VNCARGGIINEAALARAVADGKVAGAAIDVFTKEPPTGNPLLEQEKIITTPHLGASTAEAQINVALAVADQILAISKGGMPSTAINMPTISSEAMTVMDPYMKLAEKMGSLAGQLAGKRYETLEITYAGSIAEKDTNPVTISAAKGLLSSIKGGVNFVNALSLLKEGGVKLVQSKTESVNGYNNAITLKLHNDGETISVQGTVYGNKDKRIVQLNDYRVHVPSEGNMLICMIEDKPNIIGPCCVALGESKVNIGGMHVGRISEGLPQAMILSVDLAVPEETLNKIRAIQGVISAKSVKL
jgi:D-3-phosphoglycerate dehydrogenase